MASSLSRLLALGASLFVLALPAFGQDRPHSPHPALSVAPPPGWVAPPLDPLREVTVDEEQTADLDYLVSERQILVPERASFVHLAYRVGSASGLSQAAELSFTFDPAYQRVAFHHIRLLRDGRAEDRLDLADFEVIREERDRDRSLYNGRLTAIHQLRDVRVGDIVHYAYTVTGANPVFGTRYVDALSLGWSKPLRQFRYRVVRDAGGDEGAPFHRVLGELDWEPERRRLATAREELIWERSPLPALEVDEDRPYWHIGYPILQLCEFRDWAEVVAWALPLYAAPPAEGALLAKIEELRAVSEDPEARVLAALAFVQDEVRYLGIEMGPNSHRPSPPADTFARRFGDCKDKTLLLCTLLRGLGLEADPALVNTGWGRALASPLAIAANRPGLHASLPTPLAFDHVIARVRLPGGAVFWLDPTRLHQAGPLVQRGAHDFGQALLVRPDENALVDMSRPPDAAGRLHERITFTSRGLEEPAGLEIISAFEGERATSMRAYLAGTTQAQLTRDYLNYYLQKYPGLRSAEPVTWADDTARNRVEVREAYLLPGFWTRSDSGAWSADAYPHSIADLVRTPGRQTRRAPLALAHPSETLVHIRLLLHEDWNLGPHELAVEDAFVRYASTTRALGPREIFLTYHHRTKEDHVPAAEVAAYAASLAKIRADLALTLTKDAPSAETGPTVEEGFRLNLVSVCVSVLTVALGSALTWRLLRRRPGEPPPAPLHFAPSIGGWLYLFAFGVVVRVIALPVSFVSDLSPYFDGAVWERLTTVGSEARNLPLAALILGELVCNLLMILLAWVSAWLFFARRREAPRWNLVLLLYGAVLPTVDFYIVGQVGGEVSAEEWRTVTRAWMGAAIWVPYLLLSQRVKDTFVR